MLYSHNMATFEDHLEIGLSLNSRPIHSPVMLPPCRICSEKASGFHYGVNTCEACKGFFRRSLKKKTVYKCAYEGKCDTASIKRNMCATCRYKKCIKVGMSKSAIKTGRYTHEKKTKNIKEVKQLERARRAAIPPPEAAPDVVALLSKLPLQNKCEKVIEHILAAFQEHAVYTVNFFANIKEKEETYLEEKRLYEDMYGAPKPVSAEEYSKIYQLTGIDIDGRRDLVEHMIPRLEENMRRWIAFVKAVPGFQCLPLEDQIALIKISRHEMFALLSHKAFNIEHGLVTFFWGETIDIERLSTLQSVEFLDTMFSVSARIQKLDLSQTETIILSCIALFFTDRCPLTCPEKVEESQQLMLETFSYLLKKNYPDDPIRLAQCLLLFPELRSLACLLSKVEENVTVTWNDKVKFPPLLYEMWSTT